MELFVERGLGLPGRFNLLMAVTLLAAILTVPAMVWAAGRFGKHRVLIAGQGLYVIGFLSLYAVPPATLGLALPSFLVLGAGFATFSVLPASILADIIDYGALKRAEWRPGLYMAASIFLSKLAFAAATGASFGLLSLVGFDAKGANDDLRMTLFKAVALALPALLMVGAALVLMGFPIDRHRHQVIRRRLEMRAARAAI
jgi:Na+/melibiose symporter-like transporter